MFARKIVLTFLLISFSFFLLGNAPIQSMTLSEQTMPILAVSEDADGNLFGGVAQLTLEIVPGKGRVFIDTYPLTKVDTQVSTRSAKQIACDFLQRDCSEFDFIYTIKSGSSIIGGPSAGAAMTAITIATLDNQRIDKSVSITGTINPGGIVGSVGGIKQKIEAAQKRGVKTVLIPSGEAIQIEQESEVIDFTQNQSMNKTEINFLTYGDEIGINVVEVSNIFEIMEYMVAKEYPYINETIAIPTYYEENMQIIARQMCERSENLMNSISIQNQPINNNTNLSIVNKEITFSGNNTVVEDSTIDVNQTYSTAKDLQEYGKSAIEFKQYYAAASFCYGTNLNLHFILTLNQTYYSLLEEAEETLSETDLNLENYKTITDLQTYMLVEERLEEANNQIETAKDHFENNRTASAKNALITSIERVNSAVEWSRFANSYGKTYDLNPTLLRESCDLKLREAQERYNYLLLYAPFATNLFDGIEKAEEYKAEGKYELCLHKSSLAKADIDVILGSSGISEESLLERVNERIIVVEQAILRQIQKENFPLIGYSYLEYAKSLAQNDPQSSLLYLQYAIELSNIDLFFPNVKAERIQVESVSRANTLNEKSYWFLMGVLVTFFAILIVHLLFKQREKKKKRH